MKSHSLPQVPCSPHKGIPEYSGMLDLKGIKEEVTVIRDEFANLLSSYKLVERSMSRKGDCWDNAVAESFFKTLKVEHVYHHSYKTFKEAELSVFEYIETWYNVNRIHTTIKTSIRNKKEKFINQLVA
jgi:transposase InsO family protein